MEDPVLELEFDAEAHIRRELEDSSGSEEWIVYRRDTGRTTVDLERRILTDCTLNVGYVEPVKLQAQLLVLADSDWVVRTDIEVVSRWRAIAASDRVDGRATRYSKTFVVAVDGVRNQLIKRNT